MDILFAQIINGLRIGLIYAIVASGYNLLALVTRVMHFAYSHFVVLAIYLVWLFLKVTNGNIPVSIGAAIVGSILISTLLTPIFWPFIKRGASLEGFVVSLGIAIIITETMSHWLNSGNAIVFTSTISGDQTVIKLGQTIVSLGDLITLVGSIIVVVIFFYFLARTKQGVMLRAVAQNSLIARISGISVARMSILSFVLAGIMGGITAIFLILTQGIASPTLGDIFAIKCFAVLLFAGIGNLTGGLVCGVVLGILESLVTAYIAGQWASIISLSIIVLILIFKPEGIFGVKN